MGWETVMRWPSTMGLILTPRLPTSTRTWMMLAVVLSRTIAACCIRRGGAYLILFQKNIYDPQFIIIYPSIYLSIYPSIYPSIHLSIYPCILTSSHSPHLPILSNWILFMINKHIWALNYSIFNIKMGAIWSEGQYGRNQTRTVEGRKRRREKEEGE